MEIWITALVLLLFFVMAVIGSTIAVIKKRKLGSQGSNVIPMAKRKRTSRGNSDIITTGNQKCSRCGQAKQLVFYANDWGHVAGLCKACRKEIGDKQELYPI
ncbi:hypothetical protein [Paenibacillus fonticola]|uniref:hypothetical protein n=1 Tax=Paenibacillus fonticola TaxID=379896 RepID=UPI00036838DB|nr:hypothetical protein [Paenibacillus fonticola]